MAMDIRDYLPPSLKYVIAYTSQAEREKRKQEAREGFGRPTPVPHGSEEPGDTEEEPTLKVEPATPWSAGVTSSVDKEALPSALMPPPVAVSRARRRAAPVRVVSLRIVALAALVGFVVGGIVIARAMRGPQVQPAGATATANAVVSRATAVPSTTAIPSAAPSPSPAVSGAPAVPSSTATAAPSSTTSAKAMPKAASDDPYAEPPPKRREPPAIDAGRSPASKEPVITE
jgi:hypothetical protein